MNANILPIRDNKVPAIEWGPLQTESQTIIEIQSYDWQQMSGISIVCGVGGFTCIDIDKVTNDETRKTVLRELGLDETYNWQVKSGSGVGNHIWIRMNETLPIRNEKGVLKGNSKDGSFKQIEIRWNKCQTLIPPSSHASGNSYEWLNGEPDMPPTVVCAENVLKAFSAVANLDIINEKDNVPQFRKTDYVNILSDGVEEGKRNDTLAKLAGHFKKLGMEYSEAFVLLKQWNNTLTPPMPDDEVETTVKSIFSYETSKIRVYTGTEMSMLKIQPANDLVGGIIRAQSVNFLAGEEGAGKSLLAMNLGLAVATGVSKFLDYDIKKHGKVLYLNNELPFEEFLGRFKIMRGKFGNSAFAHLGNFLVPESVPAINDYWDELCKTIEQEQPIMVILDCLYWAHDKKENDSSEMKQLMRKLVELRDKFHIALIVVHHTKKGVRFDPMHNDSMRGSQVFSASSDTVLQIRRSATDESKRLFKPTKLRHGDDAMRQARLLSLESFSLWFNDEGKANEAEHLPKQNGQSSGTKATATIDWDSIFGSEETLKRAELVEKFPDASPRSVDRLLNEACKNKTLLKPKDGIYSLPDDDDLEVLPLAA